jgi:hypothetical protein
MERQILDLINKDFQESDRTTVVNYLSSIGLDHVWGLPTLMQTRMAILALAKGDVARVASLTENAKEDFRDVLMWAEKGEDGLKAEFEGNMLFLIDMAEREQMESFDGEELVKLIKSNASAVNDPEKMIERIKRIKSNEPGGSGGRKQ